MIGNIVSLKLMILWYIQLQGFSDVSLRAYRCCVYLRIEGSSGAIKCDLLSAKSRLSPTKKKSISRLESLAANLLSSLFVCVYKNLKTVYNFDEIYYWVDSSVFFALIYTMFLKFISSMFNLV